MFRLAIARADSTDNGTPGRATLDEDGASWECDTLELPWRDNERGKSCIMADIYRGQVWFSPHLNRPVVRLEDKHDRQDCLIHNGNFGGDVDRGEVTQIHGCTEVGDGYGQIKRADGELQWGILHSGATLDALIAALEVPAGEIANDADHTMLKINGVPRTFHRVEVTYSWVGVNPEGAQ